MGDGAAHLCDHVLPFIPWRQWVVSFPFEWNGPLSFQPDLLAAVERMVMDALCGWQKARTGDDGKPGAVLVRHRFGGSLDLHIHVHLLLIDGVYRKNADGGLVFVRTPDSGPAGAQTPWTAQDRIHLNFQVSLETSGGPATA